MNMADELYTRMNTEFLNRLKQPYKRDDRKKKMAEINQFRL
jgi:hypothetical protein